VQAGRRSEAAISGQHAALAHRNGGHDTVAGFKFPALDAAIVRLVSDQADVTVEVLGLHGSSHIGVLVKEAEIDGPRLAHA
jgi:hypothetical protein